MIGKIEGQMIFSAQQISYFHYILCLISLCTQSCGALELLGPGEMELFEMKVFEDILFHSLRNLEMKENSSSIS